VNPAKDVVAPANNSVWGEIAYQYGNRSSDSNASGFNSNLYQAVFGADLYHENNIKAGAGFSLSTTNVSMNSGTGSVGQGSIFVYGKMPVMQDFVLDGMASVGLSSTDVTRNDPTTINSLKAKGIKGNDVLLSAGISRPFDTDDVTITPYIRATWQMVNQSPFDEGTNSAAALSVNGYNGNAVRGVIGLAVGSKNKDPMVDPYTYKVNVAVGADTNTLINPSLNANLASYGTTIQAANVGNTFVQAGLYGTVKLNDNAFAYAGITGEARSGQTLGGVNLGVRVQF
jgi:outer membrane autotransporter protein